MPDFEYFLRLSAIGSFGHTLRGLFWFDLPLSLVMLVLWKRYVSSALRILAPGLFPIGHIRSTLNPLGANVKQFALTCVSILIGATTHLVWDSFTHPVFWPYRHFPVLRETVGFSAGITLPMYKVLQHGSTIMGLSVLLLWWARWVRSKDIEGTLHVRPLAWLLLCGALVVAFTRVLVPIAFTPHSGGVSILISGFIVTFITALWLELILFGYKLTVAK